MLLYLRECLFYIAEYFWPCYCLEVEDWDYRHLPSRMITTSHDYPKYISSIVYIARIAVETR